MIDNTQNIAGLIFSLLGFLWAAANKSLATIETRNYQIVAGALMDQIVTKVLPPYKLKQVSPLRQNLC
jgi:hypothetical protein